MPRNQEPDRNIEDPTDKEIYSAIQYLELLSESTEKKSDSRGLASAIILLILLLGVIALIWAHSS